MKNISEDLARDADERPMPAARAGHGVSRRDALLAGAATLVGGAGLALPARAKGQGTRPASPAARTSGRSARALRDTRNDPWRRKVARGSSLEAHLASVERIDPNRPLLPGLPGRDYIPVVTPNNTSLPFKIVDGVKVFHLIAEEVKHRFAEGLEAHTWGYNGRTNGPTIECVEGERVRLYVTNRLPAPTSVHWHGFILPFGMDGVTGLEHPAILPGETFKYEFTIRQSGTFMYHSHHDTMTQEGMGMGMSGGGHGAHGGSPDNDMAPVFSINGQVYPDAAPLAATLGDVEEWSIVNTTEMDHPFHLHGFRFQVVSVDGTAPAFTAWRDSINIPAEKTARFRVRLEEHPGTWMFHCHILEHAERGMMGELEVAGP